MSPIIDTDHILMSIDAGIRQGFTRIETPFSVAESFGPTLW